MTYEITIFCALAALFVIATLSCYLDHGPKAGGFMGALTMLFMGALGWTAQMGVFS